MFILSNKTIFVAFAAATCMFSSTNAQEKERRGLKSSKAIKAAGAKSSAKNYVTAVTQSLPITTNVKTGTVSNTGTVESFKENCPSETEAIKQCAAGGFRTKPDLCMTCIYGQSNLLVTTVNSVLSCSKIGGFCRGCSDDAILDFYNCGANGNLGMNPPVVGTPIVDTPFIGPPIGTGNTGLVTPGSTTSIADTPVIGPPVPIEQETDTTPTTPVIGPPVPIEQETGATPTTPVIGPPVPIEETDTTLTTPVIGPPVPIEETGTTPTTPVIGPPVSASNTTFTVPETNITITAEITSITDPNNFIQGPPPDATYCPFENTAAGESIKSGDTCNTRGYEYLQCYYPGKVCSCYAIQPLFSCLEL